MTFGVGGGSTANILQKKGSTANAVIGNAIENCRPLAEIIRLFPKKEQEYSMNVGVMRLYDSNAVVGKKELLLVSEILSLLPENERKEGLCVALARAFEAQPCIGEGILEKIKSCLEALPENKRAYFMRYHVTEIFEGLPAAKLENAASAMDRSVASINNGRMVLPEETLLGRTVDYQESCWQSKGHFKDSVEDGTLVEAIFPVGGFELHLFVKGLVAGVDHGNVLGYEPDSNTVWAIKIVKGEFDGASITHQYRHTDLQDLVKEKLVDY